MKTVACISEFVLFWFGFVSIYLLVLAKLRFVKDQEVNFHRLAKVQMLSS